MSTHYYSKEQGNLESKQEQYTFNFKDNTFKFTTDNGVFSKDYIDYGSFAMLKEFKPNDINLPILDMGAGYGPIGIVVNRLYNREVWMCEINERAYNLILKNAKDNKSENIKAFHSDLYEKVPADQLFSSVITNPPIRAGKKVVFDIYDGAYTHLSIGGELWVVIQKKQGAPSSMTHLEEVFGNCTMIDRAKGFHILKSTKNV